jgi:hypothetical protein
MFEICFVAVQCDGDAAFAESGEYCDLAEMAKNRWEVKAILPESSIEGMRHTLIMQRIVSDDRWLTLEEAMRAGFRLTCTYHKAEDMIRVIADRRTRTKSNQAAVQRATLAEALLELPIKGYLC